MGTGKRCAHVRNGGHQHALPPSENLTELAASVFLGCGLVSRQTMFRARTSCLSVHAGRGVHALQVESNRQSPIMSKLFCVLNELRLPQDPR